MSYIEGKVKIEIDIMSYPILYFVYKWNNLNKLTWQRRITSQIDTNYISFC
jgi:hypothetical protein